MKQSPIRKVALDAMALADASSSEELLRRACAMVAEPTGGMVSVYHRDLPGTSLVRVASAGLHPSVEPVTRTLGPNEVHAWGVLTRGGEFVTNLSQPGLGDPDLLDPVIASRLIHAILLPVGIGERRWGLFTASWTSPPEEALLDEVRRFVVQLSVLDDLQLTRRTLRRVQAVVEAAGEATATGLLVLAGGGSLIAYNRAMEQLTGWSAKDVRERGWANLAYPDPDMQMQASQASHALLTGALAWVDRTLACKSGERRVLRVMSRAVHVESESAPWTVGLFQDPSVRLPPPGASVAREIEAAVEQFAEAQSSELSKALASIRGHLELLNLEPNLDPVVVARLRSMTAASERAVTFAHYLRLLALPEVERAEAVDAAEELRGVIAALPPRDAARISLESDPEISAIRADSEAIRAAWEALLTHLIEQSEGQEALRLSLDMAPRPERPLLGAHGGQGGVEQVRLRVRGPGVDPALRARLALPLFRQPDLGLAVLGAVVRAHSGAIDMGPGEDELALYLPGSLGPVRRAAPLAQLGARGDELIWAVDDEDELVEFVGLSLRSRGYQVRTFSVADAVLREAEDDAARRPDLLVLDVMLATKRGPDLLREVRRRGVRAPVVWTSGYNVGTARVPLEEDMAFLSKPFRGAELAAAIRRLLDKRFV